MSSRSVACEEDDDDDRSSRRMEKGVATAQRRN